MQDIADHLSAMSQNYRPEIFDQEYLELTKKVLTNHRDKESKKVVCFVQTWIVF